MKAGIKATTALVATGSGKTTLWQMVADAAARAGELQYVYDYVPRLTLAEQGDLDWQNFSDLIGGAAIRPVGHTLNRSPLRAPDRGGFISTYQAAVKAPERHLEEARRDRGRFLLVLDEAQFCGCDEEGGGTEAGKLMREMAALARHTLIITATWLRADRTPLVLCEYTEPDERGQRFLVRQIEASLATGIAQRYLRPPEFKLMDGTLKVQDKGSVFEVRLSEDEEDESLKPVMQSPDVWVPIVDECANVLRGYQEIDRRYRALIACSEQGHAQAVLDYLRRHHPDLPAVMAVSNDGPQAAQTLRAFKRADSRHVVLVTVRMAFIGYDHKQVSVVGVLTHYRHDGHLRQLIGRGLRMWPDVPEEQQYCTIVCPDDRRMAAFVERIRSETEQGLRERGDSPPPPPGPKGPSRTVLEAEMDSPRAEGMFGRIDDPAEVQRIEAAAAAAQLRVPPSSLATFLNQYGTSQARPKPSSSGPSTKTYKESIEAKQKQIDILARQIANARITRNSLPRSRFGEAIQQVHREAHNIDGLGFLKTGQLREDRDLDRRLETMRTLV